MSREEDQDDCPDFRSAIFNLEAGESGHPNSPMVPTMFAVWKKTSNEERAALRSVCCLNARDPKNPKPMPSLSQRLIESAWQISEVK